MENRIVGTGVDAGRCCKDAPNAVLSGSRTGDLHGVPSGGPSIHHQGIRGERRCRRIVLIKGRAFSRIPEAGPVAAQGLVFRHYSNLVQSMNIVSPVFRSVMVLGQLAGAIWLCGTFGDWWRAGRYDLLVAMGAMLLILRCQGRWWTGPVPSQKSRIGLGRPEVTGLDGHEFSEGDIEELLERAAQGWPELDWAWAWKKQRDNGGGGGALWLDRVRLLRRMLEVERRRPLPRKASRRRMAGSPGGL